MAQHYLRSRACRIGEHKRCVKLTCACYCHQGEARPGVPPPDAAHFVRETMRERIKMAVNVAFIRSLSRDTIAATVQEAMKELGYEATIRPR